LEEHEFDDTIYSFANVMIRNNDDESISLKESTDDGEFTQLLGAEGYSNNHDVDDLEDEGEEFEDVSELEDDLEDKSEEEKSTDDADEDDESDTWPSRKKKAVVKVSALAASGKRKEMKDPRWDKGM
jgi:hypothetical protein